MAPRERRAPAEGACGAPLGRALFRVLRATMFDQRRSPELDVLPLAQLRLLWMIYYQPDATMKDVSTRLSVSQSTVTQLSDRLVARGLVERRADPSDRRIVRLSVSAAGEQILAEANRKQQQTLDAIWRSIPEIARTEVLRSLDLIAVAAEEYRQSHGASSQPHPDAAGPPDAQTRREETPQPVLDLMTRRIRGMRA